MAETPVSQSGVRDDEPVIAGPFSLFDGSFIIEFLRPHPSRNASVLMRSTYKHDHPLCRKGKAHPQSPPLHLHMSQSETFRVLAGRVGTTTSYTLQDTIWTPSDPPHTITPWEPHSFWPVPDSTEDAVVLVWAHPTDAPDAMDRVFFTNLLTYVSDVYEGNAGLSVLQVALTQHVSATALVWLPRAWFLGPLRWWVPWKLQAALAALASLLGRSPIMEKYTAKADWEQYQRLKGE